MNRSEDHRDDDRAAGATGLFPGAVAVSRCSVYESSAADGLHGGTPHMHLTCSEGYVVLEGAGVLQTLGPAGYREVPLAPLDVVWFEPGILHRLINAGSLRLLVVMQNGGLPEAGDAVFAFPFEVLDDLIEYRAAAAAASERDVVARRDLAVEGFVALCADPSQLERFYTAALRVVADQLAAWEVVWRTGSAAAAIRAGEAIAQLRAGEIASLREGGVYAARALETPPVLGMCGELAVVDWSSAQ